MTNTADGPLSVGEVLSERYVIRRLLGQGGMGAVYEAENTWTTRRVAIKVLKPAVALTTESVQRFMQEAQTATTLAHPNIVDILDMSRDAERDLLFIVQEFLDGRDLYQRLQAEGRLSPRDAMDVMVPIMGALSAAHERGIVHRDIKPENIFLARNRSGEVVPKLIDFGLSKLLGEGVTRLTRTGVVMGTAYYMSPEQARSDKGLDGRSDVWAVGVVLYELLSGAPPFEAENYNQLMYRILTEAAPRIETRLPDIPPSIAELVHRALESDLTLRYPTMRAFLDAVLACPALQEGPPERALSVRHAASIQPPSDSHRAALASTLPAAALVTAPPATRPPSAPPRASVVPRPSAPAGSAPDTLRETPLGWDRPSPPPAPAPAVPPAARAPRKLASVAVVVSLVGLTAGASVWLRPAPPGVEVHAAHPLPSGRLDAPPAPPAPPPAPPTPQELAPVVATAPRAVQAPSAVAPSAQPAPAAPPPAAPPAAPHRHGARHHRSAAQTPEPAPSPTPQSAFVVQ